MEQQVEQTEHIVCVGAVYIDTILSVPHFPIEDEKLRASKFARRRGGNVANSLEVLSQLVRELSPNATYNGTIQLHLLAVMPHDSSEAYKYIRDSLPNVGLENSCIFRELHSEAPSSYIFQNEADPENMTRTIVNYNGLPDMNVAEFATRAHLLEMTEGASKGWYHFEGRNPRVVLDCIGHIRHEQDMNGFKISVECEKPEREGLEQAAKEADVVFYSKLWAEKHGFNDAEDFLKEQSNGARDGTLHCCTWGASGAAAVYKTSKTHREWATVPAWKPTNVPRPVVDTVGAGDTFIAGMLFALIHYKDQPLQQKLEFANHIAGRKVLQQGFDSLGIQMAITQGC